MDPETPIRYTVGHLFVSGDADHIIRKGDPGVYVGPHPSKHYRDRGWHITRALLPDGRELECPVETSMFEAA